MDLRRGPKVNLNRGELLQLKRTVIVWTTVSRVVATKATGWYCKRLPRDCPLHPKGFVKSNNSAPQIKPKAITVPMYRAGNYVAGKMCNCMFCTKPEWETKLSCRGWHQSGYQGDDALSQRGAPSPWCRVPTCWRHTNGWISNTGSRLGLVQRNLWLQGGVNHRAHKGCRKKRGFAPTEGMTPMRRAVQLLFTGAAKFRAGTVGLRCWLVSLLDSSRSVAAVWKSLKRPQRAEPDGTQGSDDSWCSLRVQHGPVRLCTGCAASIVLLKLGALLFFVIGMKDFFFLGIRNKHETHHFFGKPRPSSENMRPTTEFCTFHTDTQH